MGKYNFFKVQLIDTNCKKTATLERLIRFTPVKYSLDSALRDTHKNLKMQK